MNLLHPVKKEIEIDLLHTFFTRELMNLIFLSWPVTAIITADFLIDRICMTCRATTNFHMKPIISG